jgi:fucose permease
LELTNAAPEESSGDTRLAILLSMAMFVLVVDTSLMNVSISAVVHDLDTTASGVQSAIALEALVSAAFILIPIVPRADSGWWMVVPLLIAGCGLGLLVSQLNNYTLSPIEEERVSEAAGVNSAGGSFGLSFGLAFAGAIMLASLSLVFSSTRTRARCSHRPSSSGSRKASRRTLR